MLAPMHSDKTIVRKLLLKPGAALALVNAPAGHAQPEGTVEAKPAAADAVLLFANDAETLVAKLPALDEALRDEARLWIAYPKAGQLGTDLDRDAVRAQLEPAGWNPVRQVALDDTWSALWFKRA